ncbi:MAG: hypothetical protein SGJ27_18220 [Candidatus Melainabacteria bacterium]|nr:hypothetical protein [Candidatus Melainabacteria bacterium]
MGKLERRNSMTLDEVSVYWRELRGTRAPATGRNRLLNSIITIDLAFEGSLSSLSKHLSQDKWERIRSDLFDVLVTSFSGYFTLHKPDTDEVLELRSDWPEEGTIEFAPKQTNRTSDILRADISRLHPSIVLSLRWVWAEGRNEITPDDFESFREASVKDESEEAAVTREFLDRLCEICVEEAKKSKRIAHRTWWRLSSEVSTCPDKQKRNQIKKQLTRLENVWGVPTS